MQEMTTVWHEDSYEAGYKAGYDDRDEVGAIFSSHAQEKCFGDGYKQGRREAFEQLVNEFSEWDPETDRRSVEFWLDSPKWQTLIKELEG